MNNNYCSNGVVRSRGKGYDCMRSAERKKMNVLEVMYLKSLVGVSRIDRVRNEEVRK